MVQKRQCYELAKFNFICLFSSGQETHSSGSLALRLGPYAWVCMLVFWWEVMCSLVITLMNDCLSSHFPYC